MTYPNLNGNAENNLGYRMLDLALKKSGHPYKLKLNLNAVNDERARAMLASGEIDIADFGSGAEFEKKFDALYFPIDQGLLGYRLAIIHESKIDEFSKINSLQDLRKYTAGQGFGWSNNVIMDKARIRVNTGPTLESLFPMLEGGRFDFLPLGLNEVYGFADQYKAKAPHAVVDSHIVLIYRFARLFYVKHGNRELHDIVLAGLKKAFDDGSFQGLLNYDPAIRSAIERANLKARVAIVIDNPIMSDAFKKIPEKYFFNPGSFK
ncbi:MAG: hypothetical protein V4805_07990 [Pseudomonadota bacterium]